jgi:creatinine amidohydrolase
MNMAIRCSRVERLDPARNCRALIALLALLLASNSQAQSPLSTKWEDLTAPDFVKAIQQSQGTCLLPIGILEKHGAHLPLGNDLINVRYLSEHAAGQEYSVVFPAYYFGQIFEARHQPGTVAYSARMQLDLLQETTDEMGRNGCKKIVVVNGHGGNEHFLPYFAQSQLAVAHDYVVYIFERPGHPDQTGRPPMKSSGYAVDYHAGEGETSRTIVSRPDLVHLDRAKSESGEDQARVHLPDSLYTGIWWYARFPNHYAGDGSVASKELGEYDTKSAINDLVAAIKAVKADDESLKLQRQFYEEATHPLNTKQ